MRIDSFPINVLKSSVNFVRIMNWLPTLQSNLIAALLLMVSNALKGDTMLLLLFIIFQLFMFAYTFVVNDVSDKEIDISAGKIRPIQSYSQKKQMLILIALSIGALVIPVYLGTYVVKIISIITFMLLTFYSLKPLRFKEKGIIGLIVAAGAQRSCLFLIYAGLVSANLTSILFFVIWLFIIGFQDELGHQLIDLKNDEISSVQTWVRKMGVKTGKRVSFMFLFLTIVFPVFAFLFFEFFAAIVIFAVLLIFRINALADLYRKTIFSSAE